MEKAKGKTGGSFVIFHGLSVYGPGREFMKKSSEI
jgi:hypothetical protein